MSLTDRVLSSRDLKNPAGTESADQMMANITREQWADFQTTFVPIENELIAEVQSNDAINTDAGEAVRLTGAAFDSASQVQSRALERSRRSLDPDQKRAMERRMSLRRAAAMAGAANATRRSGRDRRLGQLADLVGMGRGISSNAMQGISDVATMENNRNQANANARQQHRAGQLSGLAAGAAMGFQMGGPVGAGFGALAGLIL